MLVKKNYLIVLMLLYVLLFISKDLFAVDGIAGGPLPPTVPFIITGSVNPDKSFYEKDDIVTFTGTIKIDRSHWTYITGKEYHVKWYVHRAETISSNIDSLFIMDDNNDLFNFHITAKVKKLTNFVQLDMGVHRIGINKIMQAAIDQGLISSPDSPNVQWRLHHDSRMSKSIITTYPINLKLLRHKRYPHKKLNLNFRDPLKLMYNSELRFEIEDMLKC